MPGQKMPMSLKGMTNKMKILFGLFVFLIVYGIAGHMLLFGDGFFKAIVATFSTLSLHYQTAPFLIGEAFQVSITLFGVIVFWWALWTVFDLTAEGKFVEYFSEVKKMSDIGKLSGHYVICGAGRVGMHVAKLLSLEKKQCVLIDQHEPDVDAARKKGFLAIQGDPFDESILAHAGITKAHAVVAVMSETEKNILILIRAKEFNPHLRIYARSEKEEFINTLKKLGADHVIMPEAAGAIDIVNAINRDMEAMKKH